MHPLVKVFVLNVLRIGAAAHLVNPTAADASANGDSEARANETSQDKVAALEAQVARLSAKLATVEGGFRGENGDNRSSSDGKTALLPIDNMATNRTSSYGEAALVPVANVTTNRSSSESEDATQLNPYSMRVGEGPMSDHEIVTTLQRHADFNAGKNRTGKLVAIVATDSSPAFEMLIANWACNLRRVNMYPLVWALDQATHSKLKQQRIGKIFIGSIYSQRLLSLQSPDVQALWRGSVNADKLPGQGAYMAAVAFKPLVMYEVVRLGFDLLFLDVDVGLAKDPRPWILNNFNKHASDIQLSLNFPQDNMVNTGVVFAPTSHAGTHFLLGMWATRMQAHKCLGWDCGDQEMLQQILSIGCSNWKKVDKKQALVRALLPIESPFNISICLPYLLSLQTMTNNVVHTVSCGGNKTNGTLGRAVLVELLPPRFFATGHGKSISMIDKKKIVTYHANFGGVGVDKEEKLKKEIFHNTRMWCLK
jgi:hypothetical protein